MDLTVGQVAKRLGVTTRTIVRWLNAGHFANAYKLNPVITSPWRVPEESVAAFEDLRKNQVSNQVKGVV
jgi:excisionase family DNA binding protein